MNKYGKLNIVDSKTKIKKEIKKLIQDCENYEIATFCWLVNGWCDNVDYDNYNIVIQLTINGKYIPQGSFTWKEGYARTDNEYEQKMVEENSVLGADRFFLPDLRAQWLFSDSLLC